MHFNYVFYSDSGIIIEKDKYKLNGKRIVFGYLEALRKTKDANTWKSAVSYFNYLRNTKYRKNTEILLTFLALSKKYKINHVAFIKRDTIKNHPNIYLCNNKSDFFGKFVVFNISKGISTLLKNKNYIKQFNYPNIGQRFTSIFEEKTNTIHVFDPYTRVSELELDRAELLKYTAEHYKKLALDLKKLDCQLTKTQFGDFYLAKYKCFEFGIEKTIFECLNETLDEFMLKKTQNYEDEFVLIYNGVYISELNVGQRNTDHCN